MESLRLWATSEWNLRKMLGCPWISLYITATYLHAAVSIELSSEGVYREDGSPTLDGIHWEAKLPPDGIYTAAIFMLLFSSDYLWMEWATLDGIHIETSTAPVVSIKPVLHLVLS
jgi:hypothetical protein